MNGNSAVHSRLPWARVVELASELEASYVSGGEIDREIAGRLARAVLDFQAQLLGNATKRSSVIRSR
jgi:NOL1/NOP2/fmu family ribosome biogenesis protein